MVNFKQKLRRHTHSLQILKECEAQYPNNASMDLFNQISDHERGEAIPDTCGNVAGGIIGAIIAGGDRVTGVKQMPTPVSLARPRPTAQPFPLQYLQDKSRCTHST